MTLELGRKQALACARALRDGPRPVRAPAPLVPEAGRILLRNVYDWFKRTEQGVYRLTEDGQQTVLRWTQERGRQPEIGSPRKLAIRRIVPLRPILAAA